jgi:hypothetical protein
MSSKGEASARKLTIKIGKKHKNKYRMLILKKSKNKDKENF